MVIHVKVHTIEEVGAGLETQDIVESKPVKVNRKQRVSMILLSAKKGNLSDRRELRGTRLKEYQEDKSEEEDKVLSFGNVVHALFTTS